MTTVGMSRDMSEATRQIVPSMKHCTSIDWNNAKKIPVSSLHVNFYSFNGTL